MTLYFMWSNHVQSCTTIYNNVQSYTSMNNPVQSFTIIYSNVQWCTIIIHIHVQSCTTLYMYMYTRCRGILPHVLTHDQVAIFRSQRLRQLFIVETRKSLLECQKTQLSCQHVDDVIVVALNTAFSLITEFYAIFYVLILLRKVFQTNQVVG